MKVVLFCGGFGMRLREHAESTPKPMVHIGSRPILWHVMKYYAHFGHRDFILCLGWKADFIKQYFLNYNECMSNDFVLSAGGKSINLLNSDIQDWNITFVDTGTTASVGERLWAVRSHLEGEDVFLANYTDGLTDFHLPNLIDRFERSQATAAFLSVRPTQTFHTVSSREDGTVEQLKPIGQSEIWMNGGFFVMSRQMLDAIRPGEDLVSQPFERLIATGQLTTVRYPGFWSCMDTYKEKQTLDEMVERGNTPWMVWKQRNSRMEKPVLEIAPGRGLSRKLGV